MRALPGMTIVEPSGPEQIDAAVRAVAAWDGPVYLRLQIASRQIDETVPLRGLTIGKGEVLRQGADIAIITAGVTLPAALRAADLLGPEASATVVNMHTLKPLDEQLVLELARSHRAILTLENHSTVGGLGSAVAEVLALGDQKPRFGMIGVPDQFAEGGSLPFLLAKFGLDAESVAARARALLGLNTDNKNGPDS